MRWPCVAVKDEVGFIIFSFKLFYMLRFIFIGLSGRSYCNAPVKLAAVNTIHSYIFRVMVSGSTSGLWKELTGFYPAATVYTMDFSRGNSLQQELVLAIRKRIGRVQGLLSLECTRE